MKNLFYTILFFVVLTLLVSATYRCSAQPGTIGSAKMTTRVLGKLQVDSAAQFKALNINGQSPLMPDDTTFRWMGLGLKPVYDTASARAARSLANDSMLAATRQRKLIPYAGVAIVNDTIYMDPAYNASPRAADSSTVPDSAYSKYIATQGGVVTYDNFLSAPGTAIGVTAGEFAQGEVQLVRSGIYWRKIIINAPTKDSLFQVASGAAGWPFMPRQAVMSDRGVRDAILAIELWDTTLSRKPYLKGIGNRYNNSSILRDYLQIGDSATGATIAGGYNGLGFWTDSSLADSIVVIPLYSATSKLCGMATVDTRRIPQGYRVLPTAAQAMLSPSIYRSTPIQNNRSSSDKFPFGKASSLYRDYPDIFNSVVDVKLYGADSTKRYYLNKIGYGYGGQPNYYFVVEVEGQNRTLGVCSYVGTVTPNASGVNVVNMTASNSSGITGSMTVDISKASSSSAANYLSFTVQQGELSSRVLQKLSVAVDSARGNGKVASNYYVDSTISAQRFSKYPFAPQATTNKQYPYIQEAIQRVELYNANPKKSYYLKLFGWNAASNTKYFAVEEVGGTNSLNGVCYFTDTLTPNAVGTTIVNLKENVSSGSGMSGKVWIDYNRLTGYTHAGNYLTLNSTISPLEARVLIETAATAQKDTDRLLVAPQLYLVEGRKLNLYKSSMLSREYSKGQSFGYTLFRYGSHNPEVRYNETTITLDPAAITTGDTLRIWQQFDATPDKLQYRDVVTYKSLLTSLAGKQGNVLIGGDSITDFNLADKVATILNGDFGMALTYCGSRADNNIRNEGVLSWELATVTGRCTKYNTTIYTVDSTSYAATTRNTDTLNPWIRKATTADIAAHPSWCFENTPSTTAGTAGKYRELNYTQSQSAGGYTGSYYTFNAGKYFTQNISFDSTKKTVFMINWGFNDINHDAKKMDSTIQNAVMDLNIIISGLLAYKPNMIIGVNPVLTVNKSNDWNRFSIYMEKSMKLVDSFAAAGYKVFTVPEWQSNERTSTYKYTTNITDLNADNNSKIGTVNDAIHPTEIGKWMLAAPLAYFIANRMVY